MVKNDIYGDSHLISINVQIQGIDYFQHTNLRLQLQQKYNTHHEFELTADPDEFGEGQAYLLENSRQHLGKRISFFFRQYGKVVSQFTGIITQISSKKRDGSRYILIKGKSPSVLMESGSHCRSFEDRTLEEIIKEIIENYPNNLISFDINPNYKEKIPYTVQMNESDYHFLQRLSALYGENLYYNGDQFRFSAWGGKIIELMEGEDVYDYELKIEVQPQQFSTITYDPKQGDEYTLESSSQHVQSSENPFQQFARNVSYNLFSGNPTSHYLQNPNTRVEVGKAVEREKSKRQNLVYMEATSNNPELRVGDVAKMMAWMPGHEIFKNGRVPIESYKIIEIVHNFADGEGYTNTFIGVPKDLPVPPYYNESLFPKADVQHATVTDNQDPLKMGRVRVQFVWQKSGNQQSPWIQVIQPHAGTGKGTYLNPEIGETVVCAFQGGNAEAPIVLGTAYNGGEIAAYYTKGNHVKVIQTRSGNKIMFNDAEGQGSILIEDPSGNQMFMDGQGNTDINVPKRLRMNATDIELNAYNNLELNVTNQMVSNIMTGMYTFTPYYKSIVSGQMDMFSTTALIHSKSSLNLESQTLTSIGTDQLVLHTEKEAVINSKGTAYMHAEEGNNLTNKARFYEASNPEEIAVAVLEFRPLKEYKGEYGFDWLRLNEKNIAIKVKSEEAYKDIIIGGVKNVVFKKDKERNKKTNITEYKDSDEAYEALKKEYKQIPIRRDSTEAGEKEYFVPYLKLYSKEFSDKQKNTPPHPYQAKLGILSEVIEEIDKIEVECDGKTQFSEDTIINIEPSDPSGLITEKTKHAKKEEKNTLTITCNKDFDTDKEINFYAYPKGATLKTERKLIGRILLGANSEKVRKEIKIVLIPVVTQFKKNDINIGKISNEEEEYLTKILNQAFITPKIEKYSYKNSKINKFIYNISVAGEEKYNYISLGTKDNPTEYAGCIDNVCGIRMALGDRLNTELFKDLKDVMNFYDPQNPYKDYSKDYILIYIFDEICIELNTNNGLTITGNNEVILFKPHIDSPLSMAHEVLHCFGLQHTHKELNGFNGFYPSEENKALEYNRKYMFENKRTDNIMSYNNSVKFSLWHWQAKIVNPDIK